MYLLIISKEFVTYTLKLLVCYFYVIIFYTEFFKYNTNMYNQILKKKIIVEMKQSETIVFIRKQE